MRDVLGWSDFLKNIYPANYEQDALTFQTQVEEVNKRRKNSTKKNETVIFPNDSLHVMIQGDRQGINQINQEENLFLSDKIVGNWPEYQVRQGSKTFFVYDTDVEYACAKRLYGIPLLESFERKSKNFQAIHETILPQLAEELQKEIASSPADADEVLNRFTKAAKGYADHLDRLSLLKKETLGGFKDFVAVPAIHDAVKENFVKPAIGPGAPNRALLDGAVRQIQNLLRMSSGGIQYPLLDTLNHIKKSAPELGRPVPKKIHFSWTGGEIPQQYLFNLTYCIAQNPDHAVTLWTDNPTATYRAIEKFPGSNILQRLAVEEIKDPDPVTASAVHRERIGPFANHQAAGDITRLYPDRAGFYFNLNSFSDLATLDPKPKTTIVQRSEGENNPAVQELFAELEHSYTDAAFKNAPSVTLQSQDRGNILITPTGNNGEFLGDGISYTLGNGREPVTEFLGEWRQKTTGRLKDIYAPLGIRYHLPKKHLIDGNLSNGMLAIPETSEVTKEALRLQADYFDSRGETITIHASHFGWNKDNDLVYNALVLLCHKRKYLEPKLYVHSIM